MKEEKRKPGQPQKDDAKIKMPGFRLHPDVVAIIRAQPSQVKFIEDLVRKSQEK